MSSRLQGPLKEPVDTSGSCANTGLFCRSHTHSSLQVSGNHTKYNPCPSPDKAKGRRPSPKLANQNLLQLLNHCKKPSDLMLHAFRSVAHTVGTQTPPMLSHFFLGKFVPDGVLKLTQPPSPISQAPDPHVLSLINF